ncbi:MAG: hypothetical protein D3906_02900 [Candidatus Electrothrix sp. AUS1_2]|nr:hypothetical protein [Candidatus Electrothrix sp. AUS1_2]
MADPKVFNKLNKSQKFSIIFTMSIMALFSSIVLLSKYSDYVDWKEEERKAIEHLAYMETEEYKQKMEKEYDDKCWKYQAVMTNRNPVISKPLYLRYHGIRSFPEDLEEIMHQKYKKILDKYGHLITNHDKSIVYLDEDIYIKWNNGYQFEPE